jgi:hypothetical protein
LGNPVLAYVRMDSGSRGKDNAAVLGTDMNTMRSAMKRLIEMGGSGPKDSEEG